jgi:hypothetical protein
MPFIALTLQRPSHPKPKYRDDRENAPHVGSGEKVSIRRFCKSGMHFIGGLDAIP